MSATLRLFAFNCGWFQCKPGYFVEGDEGAHLRGPVPAYLIKLAQSEVLLAADCRYTERNLDTMVLPRATIDADLGRRTFERLAAMRAQGTRILFGHDGRQWATIREGVPF